MSKVLGISGSPVLESSTELLVREVLRGAASRGAETEYVYLNELDIMPCQACGETPEYEYCFFSDGMDELYKKLDWCDAIVIGSPVYFDSVSAQTKLFIDRTNCLRRFDPEHPGQFEPRMTGARRGAIVLVGGEREVYEHARRVVGGFFVWAGITSVGLITYAHAVTGRGSVAGRPDILRQAYDTGIALVKP